MLKYTQFLSIELGDKCNMHNMHTKCPINLRPKGNTLLSDKLIVELVITAYEQLGFTGRVAWHFYNEPMLQWERMLTLMEVIRIRVPQSRFLLWTNGTILVEDARFDNFELVVVTNYSNQPEDLYRKYFRKDLIIGYENFDERMIYDGEPSEQPCLRPFVEFIIDAYGEVHLCCQDWANKVKIGNVHDVPLVELVNRKMVISLGICEKITPNYPVCYTCNGRIGLPSFDDNIANRTFAFLDTIRGL